MRIFWSVNRRDGEGMAPRSSNGITINEPDQLHTRASYRFRWASLDASVDGKGKRKMDDMSGATSTGCYITGASASTSFTRNEGIAAVHGSLEPDTRPVNEPPMVQLRDIHAQTTASNAGMSDAVVYEAASDVLAGASSSFRSHIPATTYDTPIGAGTRNLRMNINSAASASTSQCTFCVSCMLTCICLHMICFGNRASKVLLDCYCCSTRNGGTGLFSSRWSRPGRQPTATRGSGVSTDIWTSYSAMIMAVSVLPFIVVQFPQILHSNSGRHTAVLLALILSVSLLVAYCLYQVYQPTLQKRHLDFAKHKHVRSRILKYLKMRALGRLVDSHGEPNIEVLAKLFNSIDANKDGSLSLPELRALVVGMQLYEININEEDAMTKVMKDFDTSENNEVEFDEFVAGVGRWLDEAKNFRKTTSIAGPDSLKYVHDYYEETKKEHDLLGDLTHEEEEEEGMDDPRTTTIKAVLLLLLGTAIAAAFADPWWMLLVIFLLQQVSRLSSSHLSCCH